MKTKLVLSIVMILLSSLASAQTYQEVIENGWGFALQHCKPILVDLDQDGLFDMLVGTREGNILHLEQTAAGSNSFDVESKTFNDIDVPYNSTPCVTDLDNDGLFDLILGSNGYSLSHYEQNSRGSLQFTLRTDTFVTFADVWNLRPTITDLEGDGKLDLFVGTLYGLVKYLKQDAIGSTTFSFVSSMFNGIDVSMYASPVFTDLNHDGLLDLIVGQNAGRFHHYRQNTAGDTVFTLVTDHFNAIDLGYISTASFVDLDQDGLLDLITGNSHGKLGHYEQDAVGSETFTLIDDDLIDNIDVDSHAAPAIIDLDGDNLLDICIGMDKARIYHYEQESFGSTRLTLEAAKWNDLDIGNFATPVFTDLDGDGLIDLIMGELDNRLFYFEQDTVGSTSFTKVSSKLSGLDVGKYPAPCFSDIDEDGLLDLLVGNEEGTLQYFEQISPNDTMFTQKSSALSGINVGSNSTPTVTDLDDDGLYDLMIGCMDGNLFHYEQDATGDTLFTLANENFADIQAVYMSFPTFVDLDRDGSEDLIVGDGDGGLHFWRNMEPGGAVRGDCNGDGDVDLLDIITAANHILGITILEGIDLWAADCNGDGDIDLLDLISIANVILGLGECEP